MQPGMDIRPFGLPLYSASIPNSLKKKMWAVS
jgi:hypothetical protein